MKDTRLIKLIKTLNKEELKSLGRLLESPFPKPRRNTVQLYNYLLKFFPDYDSPKLSKEIVFENLFEGEKFHEGKLNNLIFELTKTVEYFLVQYSIKEDEIEYLLNLSKKLLEKKLPEESLRINKLIEKKIKPGFSPGKDYISKLRRLTYLKSSYFTEVNDFENIIECKKDYFEALAMQFIIDYAEIVSSKKPAMITYGKTVENHFIDSVIKSFDIEKLLKLLDKSEYPNKPLISIHYYLLKMHNNPQNKEYYFSMKDLFHSNLKNMDREEKYIIFSNLVNYCVENFQDKSYDFKKESLDVYKKMLESEAYSFSEKENMHAMTYRNIVQACITARDSQWLEYFIETYTDCLEPAQQEDLRNLSYGHLYYIKKEYEKAIEVLSRITNEFFLFKTDHRNLMLINYYELNYTEPAFSLVDSYKHFLKSTNEISQQYKEVFRNFINYYSQLLKLKSQQSRESPEFIKRKIENEKNLVAKGWLIEKAKELINK